MGDVVYIEEWYERKVNEYAQRYRKCMGTCMEKEMKERLRVLGHRLANYKTFAIKKEKEDV
jgi:hypothetical protein